MCDFSAFIRWYYICMDCCKLPENIDYLVLEDPPFLSVTPDEIRRAIYTTNAKESLNSVIRKAIKNRQIFLNNNSAFKVIYLAAMQASKKWSMPLREWKTAMNRFQIEYGERFIAE